MKDNAMKKRFLLFILFGFLLPVSPVSARRLKNEFFYNKLCGHDTLYGYCYELNEYGIRDADKSGRREGWTCILARDEGAHVQYDCVRLNEVGGTKRAYRIDVYSLGAGPDGNCRAYGREEALDDGAVYDFHLTSTTQDCGAVTTPPKLKRKWRHAPQPRYTSFVNPVFGDKYWEIENQRMDYDTRLYPDKIVRYKEGVRAEASCLLIKNEKDWIRYECEESSYEELESYYGRYYVSYSLEVYNEGEPIERYNLKQYDCGNRSPELDDTHCGDRNSYWDAIGKGRHER